MSVHMTYMNDPVQFANHHIFSIAARHTALVRPIVVCLGFFGACNPITSRLHRLAHERRKKDFHAAIANSPATHVSHASPTVLPDDEGVVAPFAG